MFNTSQALYLAFGDEGSDISLCSCSCSFDGKSFLFGMRIAPILLLSLSTCFMIIMSWRRCCRVITVRGVDYQRIRNAIVFLRLVLLGVIIVAINWSLCFIALVKKDSTTFLFSALNILQGLLAIPLIAFMWVIYKQEKGCVNLYNSRMLSFWSPQLPFNHEAQVSHTSNSNSYFLHHIRIIRIISDFGLVV